MYVCVCVSVCIQPKIIWRMTSIIEGDSDSSVTMTHDPTQIEIYSIATSLLTL